MGCGAEPHVRKLLIDIALLNLYSILVASERRRINVQRVDSLVGLFDGV